MRVEQSRWRRALKLGAACSMAAMLSIGGCKKKDDQIKIGFVVKQAEEPWFQNEWKFAQQAADTDHFTLIKIPAPDGEKALSALDSLAAQGAQGVVICAPDIQLGTAIKDKADADGLKLITVDDRLVGADGKFIEEIHHLGISATDIGHLVGKTLYEQMQKRGWTPADTALCAVTFDQLPTAHDRTQGAIDALTSAGFPADHVYSAPEKTSDQPGAFDAVNILLTQHPDVKHWLICGMNDSAVLGAVRATEGHGLGADAVCGIGINGTDCISEFKKDKPTGFYASVLGSPKRHGYETADEMFHWIKDGKEPPKITYITGTMIDRDNFVQALLDQGLSS